MREAPVVRFRGFSVSGGFGCGGGFALMSPVGSGLDADQRAPSDRHFARTASFLFQLEKERLRDVVGDAEGFDRVIAPTASSRLPFGFLLVISPRAIVVTPSNLMEWTIGSAKI